MAAKRCRRLAVAVFVIVVGIGTPARAAVPAPPYPAKTAPSAQAGRPSYLSAADQAVTERQEPLTRAGTVIRNAVESGGKGGYAGIELGAGQVILWWKGKVPARIATAIGRARTIASVQVRAAAHSDAELRAASHRLWASAGVVHGGPVNGIQMPFDGSGITAVVAEGKAGAVKAALPKVGVGVHVAERTPFTLTSRCNDFAPWYGAVAIFNASAGLAGAVCGGNTGQHYHCTAGFAVTLGGNQYLTTAGHCGKPGDRFTDGTGETIGNAAYENVGHDLMLIRTSAAGRIWDGTPNVSDFSKPVNGWGWTFKNQSLCFSGTTSGAKCGNTVDFQWSVLCGADIRGASECYNDLISMVGGPYSQHGDSGGAVFQLEQSASQVRAEGSVTGVHAEHSEGGTTITWTLFQDFGTATRDWPGLDAITGV